MLKLKLYFSKWLQETYHCAELRKRRRRPPFSIEASLQLKNVFIQNPKPAYGDIVKISDQLGGQNEDVRVW